MKCISAKHLRPLLILCLQLGLSLWAFNGRAMEVNRIVAIVEDGVILESELNQQIEAIRAKLKGSGTQLPPKSIIRQQVLERMIINKLQIQQAERSGIHVDDQMLKRSMAELARQNNMTPQSFRKAIKKEGLEYSDFLAEMRKEILLNQLRNRLITSRIKVSDREVEHFMVTQGRQGLDQNIRYRLGHILIATPEAASPTQVQKNRDRAKKVFEKLKSGGDFNETAIASSDGSQGLSGGDLGWRRLAEIPTMFVEHVPNMQKGDLRGPIQSASGFHIIKLLEVEGKGSHMVMQTNVQHILLKTSDLFSDEDAKQKLEKLKRRIEDGDEFEALARAHSDDKASALKGGNLGWTSPGVLVPNFEQAMKELEPGKVSDPVQTQFGWHLIKVLGRMKKDNTQEYRKELAREEIRKQKIEEETELWLRRLRNEAFVEIKLDRG